MGDLMDIYLHGYTKIWCRKCGEVTFHKELGMRHADGADKVTVNVICCICKKSLQYWIRADFYYKQGNGMKAVLEFLHYQFGYKEKG